MRDFAIITDSCCSLNADEVEELGINVLPLTFTMDGKQYKDTPDHADMAPEEFFNNIGRGVMCNTSAVNQYQFYVEMKKHLKSGLDVLCVCFSSALSRTYQSAMSAAEDLRTEYPEREIIVVDSLSACRGMGMLIYRTVKNCVDKGADIHQAAAYLEEQKHHQDHWFFVDDLAQLKRGGRCGTMAAIAGGMLRIKPIMHCDADGRLTATGKVRGQELALKALVDKMEKLAIEPAKNQPIFICHANCPDYVEFISKLITERFGITDIRPDFICPVIGAHTGIGTLGLFFVGTER